MEPLQEVSQHLLTAALKLSSELTSVSVLLPAEHMGAQMGAQTGTHGHTHTRTHGHTW